MNPLPETLSTARLHLRCPVMDDAGAIFRSYAQDPQVCRFMIWVPHVSLAATEDFIASCVAAWAAGSRKAFVITEIGKSEPIGMLEARIQGSTVDIGYVLAASHWGRGFMPESIQSLTAAALQSPDIFRVQATCDTDNTASQRALEKAGFSREGVHGAVHGPSQHFFCAQSVLHVCEMPVKYEKVLTCVH